MTSFRAPSAEPRFREMNPWARANVSSNVGGGLKGQAFHQAASLHGARAFPGG